LSSLALVVRALGDSPVLMAAQVRSQAQTDGAKALRMARRYSDQHPGSAQIWLARLETERKFGARGEWKEAWKAARSSVADGQVWLWGLDFDEPLTEKAATHEVRWCCTWFKKG
jgi:hypothetical protein